jgi:hypothetical protein
MLASVAEVNGIGIGRGPNGFVVRVSLERDIGRPLPVPEEVHGVPVVVEVIGPIQAE